MKKIDADKEKEIELKKIEKDKDIELKNIDADKEKEIELKKIEKDKEIELKKIDADKEKEIELKKIGNDTELKKMNKEIYMSIVDRIQADPSNASKYIELLANIPLI